MGKAVDQNRWNIQIIVNQTQVRDVMAHPLVFIRISQLTVIHFRRRNSGCVGRRVLVSIAATGYGEQDEEHNRQHRAPLGRHLHHTALPVHVDSLLIIHELQVFRPTGKIVIQ